SNIFIQVCATLGAINFIPLWIEAIFFEQKHVKYILGNMLICFIIYLQLMALGSLAGTVQDKDNHRKKFSLEMENNMQLTDSTYIYLGMTNNYFFLYNKKVEQSEIFPKEAIKKISISRN
ncbi:MAG TPA: hypothetical protein VI757_12815, partial [Bacteroidia bacterium]|nr:hypothetical protein [Bacteroidia bacterium]